MSRVVAVEGKIVAQSPIFHGGDEKAGSTPVLRTINIWVDGIGEVPMPYLSGNAIRGKTRRMIMRDLLNLVGYELTNIKLHHVLFSGGVLESVEEEVSGVIDLAFRKRVRETLPPVALYGCAIGNQMIQGILTVEHMWPICSEYAQYLPEKYRADERVKQPVRVFTAEAFITRRDDLRAERKEDEQAVQMKVDYECFVPGTAFYHRWALLLPDPVQISCLGRVLELWAETPFIGGRSSSGDGKIQLFYDGVPSSEMYLAFVSEKREEIRALLAELEERL